MYHRRAAGRALLMAVPLLLQTLLASFPVPAAVAARPAAESSIVQTGKQLPSATERLGLKDTQPDEPTYTPQRPQDETGPLREDGTFELPAGYRENPELTPPSASMGDPYKAERRLGGKKGGGVEVLRLDISGDITANTTWALADSPVVVSGTVTVKSPAILTIEPGVVVKFEAGASLVAENGATLNAVGTASDRISFTSMKDDSVGGDTNGDGSATTPAAGDWLDLSYPGWKSGSTAYPSLGGLQFADVRYGQRLYIRYSKPALTDTVVTDMSSAGLYLEAPANTTYVIDRLTLLRNPYNLWLYAVPSNTTIQNSILNEATGFAAVQAQASTAAKLHYNQITGNSPSSLQAAILASSSAMQLRYNAIAFNRKSDGTSRGVQASGSTVDAQYNWWGSTSGPAVDGQANTGGGSSISTLVTFSNWLGSAFEADHKRGNFPWAAKAGTGVDVASGNFVYADVDLSIPTVGFPLEIRRTYNNQSATVMRPDFGAGWTWTYGTNLNVAADVYGGVAWERADGAKNYFKKNPDGSFTPEEGIYSSLTYDAGASRYTLTHKDQTRFIFDANGRLIEQVDTDGNATVISRDASGRVQTVTEPAGRQLTVTYNTASNLITRIEDPLGRAIEYTYGTGSPTAVVTVTRKDSVGGPTYAGCSYQYTSFTYQLTTVNDCNGDKLVMTYDTSKRVTTQRLNDMYTQRFTYGPGTDAPTGLTFAAGSTGVADQRGRMHVYFYITKSNKVFEHWHEQSNNGSQYSWYSADLWDYLGYLQTSHRDIDQKTTTYTWDERGNLLEEVRPGARKTTFTYDAFNNRTSAKDNLNRTTTFDYDGEQHLTKVTDPLTRETTTTYTTAGLPATVTDARSKVTSFTYDAWGYPETVTNAEAETLTFDYDAGGRKVFEETPQAKRTTYTHNSRDHVLTVTDPLNNVTTTAYDTKGRRTAVTDAENHTTTFTYNNDRNVLWKVTDAANGVVEYTYDIYGPSVTQVKDALGHTTTIGYDLIFGRKASETDPLAKDFTWTYKPSGLLATAKDALNQTTTYTYDTANDLTSIAFADAKTITQTFDGVGNRLTMVDWLGTHTWTYDALNRVTSYTDHASRTLSYTYDAVGNLSTITYPGNKTVTYTYDDANRIATVTDWDSRVTSYAYDLSGRIGSFTLPNGVATTFGYDDASRTTAVDHVQGQTTIAALDYTFDDLGNRLTKVDAAGTETYSYDALSRVTNVAYPGGASTGYTYDATGNRLTKTEASNTTSYSYDAADELTNAGDGVRTYDANGQLTKIGAHRGFTWDARQQLTEVRTNPTNSAPTANAGSNQTVYEDRLVLLDGSASADPEGEPLTYAWTEDAANPETGILRGAGSLRPGFTPATPGTYVFRLTVSDGINTSAQASVTITVQAGTPPPQDLSATAAGPASGFVDGAFPSSRFFNNDVRAGRSSSHVYKGAAQFVLPAIPADTYLSGATLDLMGKSNSNNTAGDEWSVDLLPTSVDPDWNTTASYTTIGTITPDATLSPTLQGTGQVVANSLDSWTFGSGDLAVVASRLAGSGKLSIRTKGNGAGASSYVNWYGGNATTATNRPKLTLTFSPNAQYDHAPIARAGLDQAVLLNAQTTLNGATSYDYEDAAVMYQWTASSANPAAVTLSDTTAAAPTFTPTVAGTYRFSLVVTDGTAHASDADDVVITVLRTAVPQLTTYTYNGDGDRVKQEKDSVVTEYVQDSVPKNERVIVETTGSAMTYYVYGHDLLYTIEGTTPHYLHADSLGSTVAVTDANGAIEQTFAYDIFGQFRKATGSGGLTYTFTGEENDHDGLVYLRARYYEPSTGRFTSRDLYAADGLDSQTLNRYAYVKNNPTNYVDPSGEYGAIPFATAPALGGLAAAAGAIAAAGAAAAGIVVVVVGGVALGGVALLANPMQEGADTDKPPARVAPATPSGGNPGNKGKDNKQKHEKTKEIYDKKPASEIQKAIRSFNQRIADHLVNLRDPLLKYGPRWFLISEAERQNVIRHWQTEIRGFREQIHLLEDILRSR